MSTLGVTLLLAIVIILIAVALLGIGWLITGKSKLQPGACGRDPTKKRDESSCATSCMLCEKPENIKTDDRDTAEDEEDGGVQ